MLENLLKSNPDDAFTRYAIAMELSKAGRQDDALEAYDEVIRRTPDYVPAYQMKAQMLMELDRHEEAEDVLREGLAQAEATGNNKAIGELGDLLEEVELVIG